MQLNKFLPLISLYSRAVQSVINIWGQTIKWLYCCIWSMYVLYVWLKYFVINYLLTPCSKVPLQKLTDIQLVKKFPIFYGILKVHYRIHKCISWASSIQSILPHPTSWRSILILTSHLRLGLPNGLLPSDLLTETLYTPLLSPIRTAYPAHLILLDFITRKIFG